MDAKKWIVAGVAAAVIAAGVGVGIAEYNSRRGWDSLSADIAYTPRPDYPFCRSKVALDQLTDYVDRGEAAKVERMLNDGPCMMLRDGVRLDLVERSPNGWMVVMVMGTNEMLYTVHGAIR
ncbi:hypothetical protein AAU61_06505 [Desulfocarbo indianensis]|nr:hypothetical protein AAU61_06505 [Desulfocarbo indianensis]